MGLMTQVSWQKWPKATCVRKKSSLEEALKGLIGKHQKMMLASQLRHLDFLDSEIAQLDDDWLRHLVAQVPGPLLGADERADLVRFLAERKSHMVDLVQQHAGLFPRLRDRGR